LLTSDAGDDDGEAQDSEIDDSLTELINNP
jgi:hypothetical protein